MKRFLFWLIAVSIIGALCCSCSDTPLTVQSYVQILLKQQKQLPDLGSSNFEEELKEYKKASAAILKDAGTSEKSFQAFGDKIIADPELKKQALQAMMLLEPTFIDLAGFAKGHEMITPACEKEMMEKLARSSASIMYSTQDPKVIAKRMVVRQMRLLLGCLQHTDPSIKVPKEKLGRKMPSNPAKKPPTQSDTPSAK